MPKGTACTWEITETLRKFYMISMGNGGRDGIEAAPTL